MSDNSSLASLLSRFGLALLLLLGGSHAYAQLGVSVTVAPGKPETVYPGEVTELQITLSNSNASAAINGLGWDATKAASQLPSRLRIAGSARYNCFNPADSSVSPGSGTLTADLGTSVILLAGGSIPTRANNADGTCTIIIPVKASTSNGAQDSHTYTIDGGDISGHDGQAVSNSGQVQQSIAVRAVSQPVIAKSFSNDVTYLGGAPVTLTITVTNPNPVPLENFSITDQFPTVGAGIPLIQVANTPAASATCTGTGSVPPAFSPAANATTVTASNGALAANGSCTMRVAVVATSTNGAYETSVLDNTIDGATGFPNDWGIVAANASAPIRARSPLGLRKTFAQSSLSSGESGSFTITLTNQGTASLTGVSFTDSPIDGSNASDHGLTVTGVSTTCGGTLAPTADAQGVALSNGTIPARTGSTPGSCTVTVNFTAKNEIPGVPITYTNTLVQGAVTTTMPGVVSQAASATLLVADDLRVLKTASPSSVAPGNPVRFEVTVQNFSATPRSSVTITDTLQHGMTFLTGIINGLNYTPTISGTGCGGVTTPSATGAAAPQLVIGTLPVRVNANTPSACTVTFYAMASPTAENGSSIANVLPAGSVCYNNGGSNVCNGAPSDETGGSVSTAVMGLQKSFIQSSPQREGTIVRMRLRITNNSANPLINVTLSDTLPTATGGGQMRVATPANAASTCGSPTIDAVPGNTSVAMNGATVPGRASNGTGTAGNCVLEVDVVGGAGVYSNTATASGTGTSQMFANGVPAAVQPVNASAPFTFQSALSASKSFLPTGVSSGGKSTVTVRLSNSGNVALTGVAVIDPLPAGMLLADPPNAYTTCAGGTSITAAAGAATASLNGASIAGNGSCDFRFDVVATGTANWVNIIPPNNITADGGIANQTAITATLNYSTPDNPLVTKSTNPSSLTFPGQVSRLTITVNNGPQAVSNLRLSDYFTVDGTAGGTPNGMVIAPSPAATTTCPGGVVGAAAGGSSVSLAGASLAAGASCTVSVNVTSNSVGGVTNIIPLGAITTDQGFTNTAEATTSLTTQTNIGIAKQFTPNVVKPGERSRLRLTFYNPTAQPVSNLAVTDNLPAGVTVPGGANPATTCTGASVTSPAPGQVQLSGGSIAAAAGGIAAICHAEIDVLVTAQGDYVNTIPARAVSGIMGGMPVTNDEAATDTLRAKAPLMVRKAIDSRTLDAGNPSGLTTGAASRIPGVPATMTIRLENPNATALTAAAFTDSLPSGLAVAPAPNAATTCTGGVVDAVASATTVRLAGGTIPASGFCTVTVDVLSNISGSYTNTIPSGGVTTFEGASNEEASSARLIVSTPPSVSKQFSPAVIPPSGISTLTIVIGNDNPAAATLSAALVDTLPTVPSPIVVAAEPNIQKTCPGTVTAAPGSGSVTYASGASVPAGGCTISVDVTGANGGVHNNNIPAGGLRTDLGVNQQPANAGLTVSTLGYISGKVFRDNNVEPDGLYTSGIDTPVAGVSIELREGASCGGALVSQPGLTNPATTDALGNYLFAMLPASTYTVCQPVQPSGTVNGSTRAGTIIPISGSGGTAGTGSNPTASSSRIANIALGASGSEVSGSINNNFAEIVPSTLSGAIFIDQNNDGLQNGTDAGVAAATVELSGYHYGLDGVNNGGAGDDVPVNTTVTTDASGNYAFTGLLPGTYTVTQPDQPANTSNGRTIAGTVPNGGTQGTPTAVATTPSRITGIVLPPNTVAAGNNFAEIPNARTIRGRVFLDYNDNGSADNDDYGIGGQSIDLTGIDINNNPVSRTVNTAADGSYEFAGLPPGTYTVTQPAQPAGTTNGQTIAGTAGGTATTRSTTPSAVSNIALTGTTVLAGDNNFAELPGAAPDLAIAKTHSPSSFAAGGNAGYFTITPRNVGAVDTVGLITIVDTLPAGMTVAQTPTGTGWNCNGAIGAAVVSCTSSEVIASGATGNPITLRVAVDAGLEGQILVNQVVISGGGEPPGLDGNNRDDDPVVITSAAGVQGHVWLDRSHNQRFSDPQALPQADWIVELLLDGVQVASATTGPNGAYAFDGLAPGSGYQIRFRHPETGQVFGSAVPNEDVGAKPFVHGIRDDNNNPAGADASDGTLRGLTLQAGVTVAEQSLPIDPAGIVYDAVTRNPVAGAVITITGPAGFDPATHVVGGNATIRTGTDGLYQFLLTPAAPSGNYQLVVTTYPGGYLPQPSAMIPACANALTVSSVPDPALVQSSNGAPPAGFAAHDPAACPVSTTGFAPVNQGSTQHYFSFNITVGGAGSSADVINNHIPLDPILGGAIVMSKSTPLVNVSRGDLVPYTITATNTLAAALGNIDVVDRIPPGFRYRLGSASYNGVPVEPVVKGRDLIWPNQSFAVGERKTWKLLLVVGAGVGEGEYTNQTWSLNNIVNTQVSNLASAAVRVVPDPTFDCSNIIGKVFDDQNANGYQDQGEPGIANVRIVTARGLLVTTDADGRFHVACAAIPQADRGSNFVMKLDERTLPSGYRITTENPRDVRVTRGKMVKLNFGATIHRVVRLELSGAAFEGDGVGLNEKWAAELKALPEKLRERPSVLRVAYRRGDESEAVAKDRLDAVAAEVKRLWQSDSEAKDGKEDVRNPLVVEFEVEGAK